MSDGLYDQRIKDLAAQASTFGPLANADYVHDLDNFLCGDRVTLELSKADGKVTAVGGKVRGCLLVQAAAALIAEQSPGADVATLKAAVDQVRDLMADGATTGPWSETAIFAPVHNHKHRHDCVLLPFEALAACLDEIDDT